MKRVYANGQLLTEDRNIDEGNWHHKAWDTSGRISEIRGAETVGGVTKWQADIKFSYDEKGRVTERREGDKATQLVRYEEGPEGSLKSVRWTRVGVHHIEWFLEGGKVVRKLRSTRSPNGDGLLVSAQEFFDSQGRLVEAKRLASVLQAGMDTSNLQYNSTYYKYGHFGLVGKLQPDSKKGPIATWTYDDDGRVVEDSQPNQLAIHKYNYDKTGRLLEENSQYGAGMSYRRVKSFAWDSEGRPLHDKLEYRNGYPWARGGEDYSCHSERFAAMPRRVFAERAPLERPTIEEQVACLVTKTSKVHYERCEEFPASRPEDTVLHPIHNWNTFGQPLQTFAH